MVTLSIAVVPEVGSASAKAPAESTWRWLKRISTPDIRPQPFIFEYGLENGKVSVWQSLVQRGSELVDILLLDQQVYGLGHFIICGIAF
jgi:hypothetical protein